METIKKTFTLVPNSDYHIKIHLTNEYTDLGFFDILPTNTYGYAYYGNEDYDGLGLENLL